MKKIYSFLLAASAVFSATSCQLEIVDPNFDATENAVMTITASAGVESKTVLGDNGVTTSWVAGDKLSVFDANYGSNNHCFSIVETDVDFPATTATFTCDDKPFVYPDGQEDPLLVALYPYHESAYCDFFDPQDGRNVISGLSIPTEQVAGEAGFDPSATFGLATGKKSTKDDLHFNNLYSLLRITLAEEGVKSVKVVVEGGNISGSAEILLNREVVDEAPVFNGGTLYATEEGSKMVTLKRAEDAAFETGVQYYLAIAPVTYTNIKVYLDDVLVKDTTPEGGKTLKPATIYNISKLDNQATVADGVYLNNEGVYEISNKAGLFWLADQVNVKGNTFVGKKVILTKDIDLEGESWTPIGNVSGGSNTFQGEFDGQEHTISNLNVLTEEPVGFFGYKYRGDVVNVKFDRASLKGNHYAGVVIGWTDDTNYSNNDHQDRPFMVDNCEVTNSTVTLSTKWNDSETENGDKAGAIVGYAYSIIVSNNKVSNTIITGYRDLGGIVGIAVNSSEMITTVVDNKVGEEVSIVVDNTNNYKNYTSAAQHNVNHYAGRIDGNDNVIERNTGEAKFNLPFYKAARNLDFQLTSLQSYYGEKIDIMPVVKGVTDGVVYSSSNPDVATVDPQTGVLTYGTTAGETTITASAPENETYLADSDSYKFIVTKAERKLAFKQTVVKAFNDKDFTAPQLTGVTDDVTYESTNPSVATVDASGKISLVAAGETTIKVSGKETDTHLEGVANYTLHVYITSTFGVIGVDGNWDNDIVLYKTGKDNFFVAYGVEFKNTESQFKIRKISSWDDPACNFGTTGTAKKSPNSVVGVYTHGDSGQIKVSAGTYDIYFDRLAGQVYIMEAGKSYTEATKPSKPNYNYGLVGSFTSWNSNLNMNYSGDGVWTLVRKFTKTEEWKIRKDSDWNTACNSVWVGWELKTDVGSDNNLQMNEDGEYIVVFIEKDAKQGNSLITILKK